MCYGVSLCYGVSPYYVEWVTGYLCGSHEEVKSPKVLLQEVRAWVPLNFYSITLPDYTNRDKVDYNPTGKNRWGRWQKSWNKMKS